MYWGDESCRQSRCSCTVCHPGDKLCWNDILRLNPTLSSYLKDILTQHRAQSCVFFLSSSIILLLLVVGFFVCLLNTSMTMLIGRQSIDPVLSSSRPAHSCVKLTVVSSYFPTKHPVGYCYDLGGVSVSTSCCTSRPLHPTSAAPTFLHAYLYIYMYLYI